MAQFLTRRVCVTSVCARENEKARIRALAKSSSWYLQDKRVFRTARVAQARAITPNTLLSLDVGLISRRKPGYPGTRRK